MQPVENRKTTEAPDGQVTAPAVSLPKGGGAIRGIGEKFAANPVTGTGSMSVPIFTSPGRAGFGPQLSLSYDSGAGNGPFGFGWRLSLPSITRKTEKGLPQYLDVLESDVFVLSGAEDLVPILNPDGTRFKDDTTVPGYTIHRYCPRIEGLFARIERWTRDDGDVHWRSISKDNNLTYYGKDKDSRIFDPDDSRRVFSWLICETRDDKGNAVLYEYKPEDGVGVDLTRAHERNRGDRIDPRRATNRYLKRIRYGNVVSLLDNAVQRPRVLTEEQLLNAQWMFEVVFDYGEHDDNAPKPNDTGSWNYRSDPFSSYRAGFEVRTGRLCQRVLMFHQFAGEPGFGNDCLVRSTDFTYLHEEVPDDARNAVYTFLLSVTQSGYKGNSGRYLKRSLPPVEFEYTQPIVQDTVEEVDPASLENLPIGLDGSAYQWTDLHGEGIPGILTEQAGAWFYKRNLSPISSKSSNGVAHSTAKFAPVEMVAAKPNLALADGAQFMDLAGDGQTDLVVLDGPTAGLYEHDASEDWQPFHPFTSRLNRDMRDPNLKFVDLDGDGHADVLISEDDAFVWHSSLAEEGFGPARRVHQALDEEKGPRLVFADGTQSIYLADLSGDGLTDLVRIRNGEVCYWPNLGYGRFGAKVTMDQAPHFDNPDQFDQKRIRLADIDGSGTSDIIYLHRDGVRLYFNQSGNGWSEPQQLNVFPRVDDLVSIVPTDLLGNGTACLVWSSPLPGDVRRHMRYVDLMGGQKPHLLIRTKNNLGAETEVQYAPSTKFYLADKFAGSPWITKLPFPVQCVEKVTVKDKWRKTEFSTTYSYHHGYFDGTEREFRGFGRVEQVDVESFGEFIAGNVDSPFITNDHTLFQPPVKTITWFHTGAALDRQRILTQFQAEYFPSALAALPGYSVLLPGFNEKPLPEPDLESQGLNADEWREALRACKGMALRQEVYELDVDQLEVGKQIPVRLFTAATHNCHIRRLQPKGRNQHAVFLVTESEALSYHYELNLRSVTFPANPGAVEPLEPDPRVAHTLHLSFDKYGNIQQSVAVGYRRLRPFADADLTEHLAVIHDVQGEQHLGYTETHYTGDVVEPAAGTAIIQHHRLRVPWEVQTYELAGISPAHGRYFDLVELRGYRLSDTLPNQGSIPVGKLKYHELPQTTAANMRLVEHARTLFFKDNPADTLDFLKKPLPLGTLGPLGLPYEQYKLALTEALLNAVFTDGQLDDTAPNGSTVRNMLSEPLISGYIKGTHFFPQPGPIAPPEAANEYWMRSGTAGFEPDAALHFYLPERYTDPFGNITTLKYDWRDLFIQSSTDALGNTTRVTQFDFRVLTPREMQDINDNLSEVFFDVLGLPTAMAVKGKGSEGDNLTGFTDALSHPALTDLERFFDQPDLDETQARTWLGNATARHIYYFGETEEKRPDGTTVTRWGQHPACACGIVRETHMGQLAPGERSLLQAAFEYSDGLGSVVVKKVQAEPESGGQPLRWIANGKTILNNKGKPVKQYEPYFSPPEVGHRFEEPREEGVTPLMYYDAAGRIVRTEMPDGTFSRVDFSPWHVASYDPNDTTFEPTERSDWYKRRMDPTHPRFAEFNGPENVRAAELAETHADTPALTVLDSLGREVVSIAHNRFRNNAGGLVDEKYLTFTKLDAEGKPLWIRDARGHLVMQYITPVKVNNDPSDAMPTHAVPCYDIAGNLLFQ
ncbi:MAG: SpvB/TcaC N-terminal domain-containing protein, partial [Planctomycetota bacterium]